MPLHPQAQALIDRMLGSAPIHTLPIAEARQLASGVSIGLDPGCTVARTRDLVLDRPDGPGITARLYEPVSATDEILVWCHGGGWSLLSMRDADACATRLANRSGCAVLSLEYRLAPEHPFPAALHDVREALAWASRRWARVVVGGDSAGGNIAAAAALWARDSAKLSLAGQLLVYPPTDHDFDTESYLRFQTGLPTTRATMRWYWDMYVPDLDQRRDPLASPLRSASLAGLPPAVLVVAGHDALRSEVVAYAERLRAEAGGLWYREFADMQHGFFTVPGRLDRPVEAIDWASGALRELLSTPAREPA
jgi:acetyl esterase